MTNKHLILLLLVLLGTQNSFSQTNRRLFLSLEPSVMLGNRKFKTDKEQELYITNANALGAGINFGFQLEKKNWFTNLQMQLAAVQNSIRIDYPASGLNDFNDIKYSKQKYPFGYGTSVGLALSGGYKVAVSKKSTIYLGTGVHADVYPIQPLSHATNVNVKNAAGSDYLMVYYEEITNFKTLAVGADFFANYAFHLGSLECFTGAHYRLNPGKIKGRFVSFPGYAAENSGTFEINRSTVALTLGIFIGRKLQKE